MESTGLTLAEYLQYGAALIAIIGGFFAFVRPALRVVGEYGKLDIRVRAIEHVIFDKESGNSALSRQVGHLRGQLGLND